MKLYTEIEIDFEMVIIHDNANCLLMHVNCIIIKTCIDKKSIYRPQVYYKSRRPNQTIRTRSWVNFKKTQFEMEFLRIQRLCLNGIGYSFKHNESRGRQIFALLSWVSILIVIIPEWHFVIENISDIPLATDALCPLLTSILTISKVMTFYFRKGKFYDIIEQLDNMWLKSKI